MDGQYPCTDLSQWNSSGAEDRLVEPGALSRHGVNAFSKLFSPTQHPRIFQFIFSDDTSYYLRTLRRYSSPKCPTIGWDDVWGHKHHAGPKPRGPKSFANISAYESLAIMTLLMHASLIFPFASPRLVSAFSTSSDFRFQHSNRSLSRPYSCMHYQYPHSPRLVSAPHQISPSTAIRTGFGSGDVQFSTSHRGIMFH